MSVLRVVSFNVHGLYVASRHRARRMAAIGALLRELAPDLVALQEAFVERDRCELARALAGSRLTHSAYFPSGFVGSGLMVIASAPITATAFRAFEHNGHWWKPWEGDWYAGKGVALARVDLPSGPLDLFDTHAIAAYGRGRDANHGERCAQMVELADFVLEQRRPEFPALVAGDLNATLDQGPYRIAAALGGFRRLAQGATGLDHVLAVPGEACAIEPLETRLLREETRIGARRVPLSDHPAVLATVRAFTTDTPCAISVPLRPTSTPRAAERCASSHR